MIVDEDEASDNGQAAAADDTAMQTANDEEFAWQLQVGLFTLSLLKWYTLQSSPFATLIILRLWIFGTLFL